MILKRFLLTASILLGLSLLAGCKHEALDGDWPAIKVTINGKYHKPATYEVSPEGGEYKVYSKNYGSLWLCTIWENGEVVWPDKDDPRYNFRDIHLVGKWYEVQYDAEGNLVVKIQSKDDDAESRSLTFELESGDAFKTLIFEQK